MAVEIREPLVFRSNPVQTRTKTGHPYWMVYFTTSVAVCGSYQFGTCTGYSSPAEDSIREDLSLSLAEYSLFGSLLTFGAMIGAITSGKIADFIGRKGAMRIASAFCFAGWVAIAFAEGPLPLYLGRLATGYGMGVFSFTVPVFIAEIAPTNVRGTLTTINEVTICSAIAISFILGTVISWRALAVTGLIPCTLQFVGLFFVPESPRWLAKVGRGKEFEASLQRLRGKHVDISNEAIEIEDYIAKLEELPKAKFFELFKRRYLRSVIIGVGLMVCQQYGGLNGINFYVKNIFESAGFSGNIGSISYACLQTLLTALGATCLVDRVGRKPLLLVSSSGALAGCALTATAFYLKEHDLATEQVPTLALVGLLVYIGSFALGMGAVPWVVMSEVFPINIKGQAGSLATLVNWSGAWLSTFSFNFLVSWSTYGTFILFGAVNLLAILFISVVVPETKGRSLEQIQSALNA